MIDSAHFRHCSALFSALAACRSVRERKRKVAFELQIVCPPPPLSVALSARSYVRVALSTFREED